MNIRLLIIHSIFCLISNHAAMLSPSNQAGSLQGDVPIPNQEELLIERVPEGLCQQDLGRFHLRWRAPGNLHVIMATA